MEERIYENVPSLCGSISHSNLRDIAVCERQDHPEIVEVPSHYDVPRIHSRSQSLSGLNTWSTHRLDTGSIGESSSSPLSDNSVEFQSASVPGSPQSSCKDCGQIDPIMSNRDWSIYNSLGSSSSKEGKPSFALLGLTKNVIKTGIMSKTGPCPSWCSKWNRRVFVLKGNFLFYFDPLDKPLLSAPVLGGAYIKNSMVERISLPFTKKILRITPQVPRRLGWSKQCRNESFYIKFRTEEGRDEWYEELTTVSVGQAESLTKA